MFRELLVVDSLRGPDSTGVANVTTNRNVGIVKHAMLPQDIFNWKPFSDLMLKQNNVLIGHNRWATKGAVNRINAHPFECGDIVGVHNGTLHQQSLLPDYLQFEVDSENIMHSIDLEGIESTYKKINGAAALVWWDKSEATLNFLRNKERSFFYCFTENNKTLLWASEDWMLLSIAYRNNVDIGPIVETEVDTHYMFRVPSHANTTVYPEWGLGGTFKLTPYKFYTYNSKKKSKVTNILPAAKGGKLLKKDLELRTGSLVTFAIEKGSHLKPEGLIGWTLDGSSIEVALVGGRKSALYEELVKGEGSYEGKVNSFYRRNDEVWKVVVQLNSIKKKMSLSKPFIINGQKTWLDEEAFNKAVIDGCGWCSEPKIKFEEGVIFDEDGDPYCPSCSQLHDVQYYLDLGTTYNLMN